MFVICKGQPEHPEETQADTEHANSTWKLDMQFNENHKCQPCDVVTRRKLTEHQHHSLKTVYRSITVQSYLSKLVKIFQWEAKLGQWQSILLSLVINRPLLSLLFPSKRKSFKEPVRLIYVWFIAPASFTVCVLNINPKLTFTGYSLF